MAIVVNLDVMLARRKMSLSELSEKVDISIVNLSILKTGKAKAVRFSTLEKLCEESYRTVSPNYFEVVMKYRYLRSEDDTDYDLKMYDLILAGNTFNFGLIYSSVLDNPSFAFRHLVGRDGSENFASYWGAKDTTVKRNFKGLVNWFLEE